MYDNDCCHIMPSGRRCGSPRQTSHRFCHWHLRLRQDFNLPGTPNYRPVGLEDANSVTIALNHIWFAQSRGLLDPRAARHMQWTLRLLLQSFQKHDRPQPIEMHIEGSETFDPEYHEIVSAGTPTCTGLCGADTLVQEKPQPTKTAPRHTNNVPPQASSSKNNQSPIINSDVQITRCSDDQIDQPMTQAQLRRIIDLVKIAGQRNAGLCTADTPVREKPQPTKTVPGHTNSVTPCGSPITNNQSPINNPDIEITRSATPALSAT